MKLPKHAVVIWAGDEWQGSVVFETLAECRAYEAGYAQSQTDNGEDTGNVMVYPDDLENYDAEEIKKINRFIKEEA
jgi:hypothetical protein